MEVDSEITINILILFGLLFAIQVKHLVVDFMLQPPYMWQNKGRVDHPGGYIHAFLHAFATFLIFVWFDFSLAIMVALVDFFAHFIIDFWKVNVNQRDGLTANDEKFWVRLGIDQFLHQMTYVAILFVAFNM